MRGLRWIKRPATDPFLRQVLDIEVVLSVSGGTLFAVTLSCGHTMYPAAGHFSPGNKPTSRERRCPVCVSEARAKRPEARESTPAEAAVAGYVAGAGVGVFAAARAAIALEAVW